MARPGPPRDARTYMLSPLASGSSTPTPPSQPTASRWEHAKLWGFVAGWVSFGLTGEGELVSKLVWRVKLVAELQAGVTTEVEVGRLERDEQASVADLGLRLAEAKQITAALQAEMVPRQVTVV